MANMSLNKVPMPVQEPLIRARTFEEVEQGYTEDMAVEEAGRCLNCPKKPCVSGCPVGADIPGFITKIAARDFEGAFTAAVSANPLCAVCGRVCPQETQCEGKCLRGIKGEPVAIGRLERFAADWARENGKIKIQPPKAFNGKKAAVVGSGPAGLTCAGELAKKGYAVTIFEAFHEPGGVLMYGIPEFRLPKDIVKAEIKQLEDIGVEIKTNMVIGRTITVEELKEEFDAVFIGSGAGLPSFMGIEGESLIGVCSANEYLTRINLMKGYLEEYDTPVLKSKTLAVVGGGNVAMDAARCGLRMGAEKVYIVYRRSENEMPARKMEIHHAKEEGVEFLTLVNPVKINGENGRVSSMECVKMELGEPDEKGRRRPVVVEGSNFEIPVDTVVMAIGTSPNPLIRTTTDGLASDKWGCLVVDENLQTTCKGVYAGGDAVTGAATVILAMGAGKQAAAAIDKQLSASNTKGL